MLAEDVVVSGEDRLENVLFPGDDQSQKLLDAAHCVDGVVASLEKFLQITEAGDLRGLAHEHQRGAGKASIGQEIEELSEVLYEVDLPLTVLAPTDLAVGAAISGGIDCRDSCPEVQDHGGVEIFKTASSAHARRSPGLRAARGVNVGPLRGVTVRVARQVTVRVAREVTVRVTRGVTVRATLGVAKSRIQL